MQSGNLKLNSAWGAALLFLGVYAFAYGPYFLYAALPDVQQDSYIYFWAAGLLRDGVLPFPKFTIDVPVGHPVFVWAVKSLTGKTGDVIIAQNLLFIASCLYAIFCFSKINRAFAWIAAVAFSLYSIDNFTMRMNTSLYSECLYTTLLIFITARLVVFFAEKSLSSLIILVISLLLPGLVRPNGIFAFFLVAPLAFFIWKQKLPLKFTYSLAGTLVATILLWSGINYVFKGIFLPSDPNRIEFILNNLKRSEAQKLSHTTPANAPKSITRGELLVRNLTSIAKSKPSFYFTYIPDRYEYLYEKPLYADSNQRLFDRFNVDSAAPGLKKYLFAEFIDNSEATKSVKVLADLQGSHKSRWMYVNHILYRIYDLAIWNYLWVILFYAAGLWLLTMFFLKPSNQINYLLLLLFAMHVVSVIIITVGHLAFQTRYPHTSEFLVLLVVPLTIFQIIQSSFVKK